MSSKISNHFRGGVQHNPPYAKLNPVYTKLPTTRKNYATTYKTDIKVSRLKKSNKKESVHSSISKKIKLVKDRYSDRSRPTIAFLNCFENFVKAIKWVESNSNLTARISETLTSAAEQLEYALTFISPILRVALLFRLRGINSDLQRNIQQIHNQHPNLYSTRSVTLLPDRKESYKIARENINQLQLLALKNKEKITKKIIQIFVKAVPYFTYSIVVAAKILEDGLAKPIYKLFVSSLKELIKLYITISKINKQHEYTSSLTTDIVIDKSGKASSESNEAGKFLKKLQRCKNIASVKKEMKAAGIDLVIPTDIKQFQYLLKTKRYQNLLIEKYEYGMRKNSFFSRTFQYHLSNQPGKKPYVNGEYVNTLLEKRHQEHQEKLNLLQIEILKEIQECQKYNDFESIVKHFNDIQIDLSKLEDPIVDIDEWFETTPNDDLIKEMAKAKLSTIEAEAHSLQLAVRQTLLVKHQLERPFFFYAIFESFAIILTKTAQFVASYLSFVGFTKQFKNIIELILSDLIKKSYLAPAMSFFSFIADMTFQVVNILLAVIKFSFSRFYKPNEFSLDGLYYEILLKGLQLSKSINNVYFASKKIFISLRTALDEKVIHRGRVERNNDKYATITAKRDNFNKRVKESSKAVEALINDLKLRDFDRALSPHSGGKDQNNNNINAIETIKSTLAKGNIKYYPKDVVEFLNRHLDLGIHESEDGAPFGEVKSSRLSAINDLYTAEANDFLDQIKDKEISHYFPTQSK
jgi:hypothetical protein